MIKNTRVQVAFFLAVLAVMIPSLSAAGFAPQDSDEDETVPLEKILASPEAFQAIPVSFVVQFHRLENFDNPVFTRYLRQWQMNFSAWPDGQRIWDRAGYQHDHPFFFVRRDSDGAKTLLKAPAYSRWIIAGVVTRVFKGLPWIEVKGLERLPNQMDATSLTAMAKGFDLLNKKKFAEAAAAFQYAEGDSLPWHARSVAYREEAHALHSAGDTAKAVKRLESAQGALPDDPALGMALQRYRSELAMAEQVKREQEAALAQAGTTAQEPSAGQPDESTGESAAQPLTQTAPAQPEVAQVEPTQAPTEPEVTQPEPTEAPTEPEVTQPEPAEAPTEPEVTQPEPAEAPTEPEVTQPEPTEAPAEPEASAPAEPIQPAHPTPPGVGEPVLSFPPMPEAQPAEAPTETPTETPTESPMEAPVETLTETPTETPAETPAEAPNEVPTEIPTEAPTETPTQAPTATVTPDPDSKGQVTTAPPVATAKAPKATQPGKRPVPKTSLEVVPAIPADAARNPRSGQPKPKSSVGN